MATWNYQNIPHIKYAFFFVYLVSFIWFMKFKLLLGWKYYYSIWIKILTQIYSIYINLYVIKLHSQQLSIAKQIKHGWY